MRATIACGAMTFEHVLVVGAGQMGGGIAQVVAASGRRVSLHDAAPGAVERGLQSIERSRVKGVTGACRRPGCNWEIRITRWLK